MLSIIQTSQNNFNHLILNNTAEKQVKSRLYRYYVWLNNNSKSLWDVPLIEYITYMHNTGLSNATINAYISSICVQYHNLIQERAFIYQILPDAETLADKKAMMDEFITRMEHKIENVPKPKMIINQDTEDEDGYHVWLTQDEVKGLFMPLNSYIPTNITSIRNSAIIALFLMTGCREAELLQTTPRDLNVKIGGINSLRIKKGKGSKKRIVPYGDSTLIHYIHRWLAIVNTESFIFTRVYKNQKTIGNNHLSSFAIQEIVSQHCVIRDNKEIRIKPHDLRRTYARQCYLTGMPIYEIQSNLGHTDEKTTKRYIGNLPNSMRVPSNLYAMDT